MVTLFKKPVPNVVWALTLEEALGSEVGDCQAQDGELVQLGDDALLEGQQTGQMIQLAIQALSVSLARVTLRGVFGWGLYAAPRGKTRKQAEDKRILRIEYIITWKVYVPTTVIVRAFFLSMVGLTLIRCLFLSRIF